MRWLVVISSIVGAIFLMAPAATAEPRVASETAVRCAVYVDDPHFTPRAGGIIAKVRVTCRGESDEPAVQVQIVARLGSLPGSRENGPAFGPPAPRGTTNQTQAVQVNGDATTIYVPEVGASLSQHPGWFEVSAMGRIVAPDGVKMDNWTRPTVKTAYVSVP